MEYTVKFWYLQLCKVFLIFVRIYGIIRYDYINRRTITLLEDTTDIHNIPKRAVRRFYSILSTFVIISFFTPFYSKNAYALDTPQPIYPNNNAHTTPSSDPPIGVPLFSWSTITGAVFYRLQVDNESGFNQPVFLDITTQNSSYTSINREQLFPDGDWYWRVRVEDPSPVGNWSTVYHFRKIWATPENRPVLLEPAIGESVAFFDSPIFSWAPSLGAASYLFQISDSPNDFSAPKISINTLSTSYQPNERIANRTYYWRIIPIDAAGHLGIPSNVQSFILAYGSQSIEGMIPSLLSPNEEADMTFTPTFHWTAVKGAEFYRLEYTSNASCDFGTATKIESHQTFYTPTDTLPNASIYCWRVRAESGPAIGDWSSIGHFYKTWDIKPILLTPTDLYQTDLYPIYSWTPVPGASHYLIQISQNADFDPIYEEGYTSTTQYSPQNQYEGTAHYYWRVLPIDGGGEYGTASVVGEYQSLYDSLAPILIYPQYYYPPNGNGDFIVNPHEDRTVAFPIFMWHRVMTPTPTGGVYALAYRIQVDDSPYFNSIDWQYDTENTNASPTVAAPFSPTKDVDYFWRVCPLTSRYGGECVINPDTGMPWWSQVWIARFNDSLRLTPTIGETPELLRPIRGQEAVESTPLLEWCPMEGAIEYQVQVSRDDDFSSSEITQTVTIPAYSPGFSLAQRNLDRTDYGTFYWHVRGLTEHGWSAWSEVWRFQIASQSEWRFTRVPGDLKNRLLIGDDPASDAAIYYDLTGLSSSQSVTDWYFGFYANVSNTDMTYVLYIDLDNVDGSGATSPPERDYKVWTKTEHQPEYAVIIDVIGGSVNAQNTWLYAWTGDSWGIGRKLADLGGELYSTPGYIEIKIPNERIGMNQDTGSASVILFSVDISDGEVMDTVPSDPSVPGPTVLTRFSAISDKMNLIYPPSTVSGDPSALASFMPFYWDWPTGSDGATPYAGSILQVDLDQNYSLPHEVTYQVSSSTSYFSENNITLLNDVLGDNLYFWRVQPRYMLEGHPEEFGAWTGGWSFKRQGFSAENLHASTTDSVVSFSWDIAEGADSYRLQVASDQDYNNTLIDIITPVNSYSILETLPQGLYYWRVEIIKYSNIYNAWTNGEPFELTLSLPEGLIPANNDQVQKTPTFCWNPIDIYDASGFSIFTAWKYNVQVATEPTFGYIYDTIDTSNHCWTPTMGYVDDTYYWRVAMYDGDGRVGPYSQTAVFSKRYSAPELVSPVKKTIPSTPIFIWKNVNGAASYEFESSRYPDFSKVYDAVETIVTQYTPTKNYEINRVYYWRVSIRDLNGVQGPYSQSRFIIGEVEFNYLPQIRR